MVDQKNVDVPLGQALYEEWRDNLLADPERRAVYEEEAAKKELWLQLVEARQEAGLTQDVLAERLGVSRAQVGRIEKRGYDICSLATLRRYVQALGGEFRLEVSVRKTGTKTAARAAAG